MRLEGFELLSRTEGIIPALEPSHAIAYVAKLAPTLGRRMGRERLSVLARVVPVVPAMALLALPTIPMVVLYLVGQRFFIRGLTAGATKG